MDFNSQDSQEIMKKFKSIISSRLEKLDNEKGSDGELYAYSIAVNNQKKKKAKETTPDITMENSKLREMVIDALTEKKKAKPNSRPDYPDIDKDGDREESMKKAAQDKKKMTEGKGQDKAKQFVSLLREKVFKNLTDDELEEFKKELALALDMKLSENINLNEGITDEIRNYFEMMIENQPEDVLELIMDLVNNDGKNWDGWIDNIQADIVDTSGGDYEGDIRGYREELEEDLDLDHKVKYSKSNDTYQVWLGDKIVTDFATKERAEKEAKRLNHLQDAKKLNKTQMKEDLDLGHEDDEPHMIKAELAQIGKYAMELYKMVDQFEGPQEVDFPGWWQSKITTAKNMISSAKHYLEFELEEPKIDAMVDVASEEEAIGEGKLTDKEEKIVKGLKKSGFKKGDPEMYAIAKSKAKAKIKEAILAKLKNK